MQAKFKEILKLLSIPLIILAVYLILIPVWNISGFPSGDRLIEILQDAFANYGLWIVLVGAIFEGLLLIGFYFPGATIIFLGVILAGNDLGMVAKIVIIVSLGFIISYIIDYLIGKYGWYKLLVKFGLKSSIDDARKKIENNGLHAIMLSYWNPNFASIIATAAGVLESPFWKFFTYNFIGVIAWNIIWGVLAVFLGENAMKYMGIKYVILFIILWIVVLLIKNYLYKRKKNQKSIRNSNP
jgi:membrane-associated protein